MRYIIISFCLLISISFPILGQSLPEYVENQLIVKFSEDVYSTFQSVPSDQPFDLTDDEDIIGLFTSLEVTKFERLHPIEEYTELGVQSGMNREFVIYYSEDIKVPDAILAAIQNRDIEEATPNHLYYIEIAPNDQYYSNQWSLPKISMPGAWDLQQGSVDIRIAILDVGFKLDHTDLSSKFSATYKRDETDISTQYYINQGYSLISGEDYTTADNDPTGKGTHGTHVSGISAASTNNSTGIAGVGWNNILVPVRCGFQIIHPQYGSVGLLETDDWIRALDWVRNNTTAKVVNMSFGRPYSGGSNPSEQNAIYNALNAGIVICASSGNSNLSNVGYPAAYPGVIAVGATNENDNRCSTSDWGTGYGSNYGSQLSIVAPGNNIYSTYFDGSGNSTYQYLDGTSMASPHVAGAAALLLSNNPNLSPAEIKSILEGSATKVMGMGGQNFHVEYGYGRLNVHQALLNTPLNFQFVNNIQSTENYGDLIINNDLNNPVSSGGFRNFTTGTNHQVRTDELPFILNWSGSTQKVNRWYQNNSDYNLNLQFTATGGEEYKKDARFEPTAPVTIKNYLLEVGNNIGQVELKDPWFYYQSGNNWYQSNEFKTYSSPFNILNNITESYGGVFLNQLISSGIYYSVRSLPQDINLGGSIGTRMFYFQNWTGTGATFQDANSYQTPVVFTSGGAIVQANYKGHMLSNHSTTLNSQQRKMIHIGDDVFYLVYESMDKCWVTEAQWGFSDQWSEDTDISQKNSSLNQLASFKNPSVDNIGENVFIVFEYKEPGSSTAYIMLARDYSYNTSGQCIIETIDSYPASFFGQAKPLVAAFQYGTSYNDEIVVLYKKSSSQGLYYRNFAYNGGNYSWQPVHSLTGTSGASVNFSIAPAKTTTDHKLHIAYEENMASIKYLCLYAFPSKLTSGQTTISTNSPYQNNYSPSISVTGQNKIVASWTGASGIMLGKGNETETTYEYKTVVRPYETSWGNFLVAGNNVNNTYSSSTTNTSQSQSIISWNENQNTSSKYLRRLGTYYCPTKPLTPNGIMPVVSAASNLTEARSLVLNTSTTPYALYKSTTNFNEICEMEDEGGLDKITENGLITYGRTGLVFINGVGFIFETGDVVAGDSIIKFIDKPDTIFYSNTNQLNEAVITNTFELDQNSSLIFSNKYYTIFSEFADTALTENDNVTFRVELVNANTNTVVGTFDNVTYDKNNLDKLENIAYEVNCSGIEAGEYFLRLVTTVNGNAEYNLANVMSDASELEKKNFSTIYFDGNGLPTTYEISQNYPNPFNPTTVINYQIPKDGIVTIKVYDILGKEVTTLVNENKSVGRYSINFDGSNLASGVYIYRITSGDFVATKKMMMIK